MHKANIEIKDKEFLILVGPSGCGKSTTLRMIAGLEDISGGEMMIGDKVINDIPPRDRDIAMVFQDYALYPHMTVYENMAFGLKIRKMPKDEIDKRVRESAAILHIENLLERKPKVMSGGQRQRVALGRAIVRQPKVFLFDEPLSNLDAKLRVVMRTELSILHKRLETTMVYVTHDQVEAMTMASRIVVMKDGWVQQIDSPYNLYNFPCNKFVAGFIGSPPMNFIKVEVKDINGKIAVSTNEFTLHPNEKQQEKLKQYVNKEIVFGVRPEDIYLKAERPDSKNMIKAFVEVLEPLGAETLVYFKTKKLSEMDIAGEKIIAKVSPNYKVEPGETIDFAIDMEKTHFFNTEETTREDGNKEEVCIV